MDLVDIVELDKLTDCERVIPICTNLTSEDADKAIEWREKNIVNRYSYRKVAAGSFKEE